MEPRASGRGDALSTAAAQLSRVGCCIARSRTSSQSLELATRTKRLHLAALWRFFNCLVNRHACVINPAATVKAERYSVVEGKTPEIGPEQARTLLRSIDVSDPVGLRDRAILAVLVSTAARVGAVAKLTVKNLFNANALR